MKESMMKRPARGGAMVAVLGIVTVLLVGFVAVPSWGHTTRATLPAFRVTLQTSAKNLAVGKRVRLSGTVAPARDASRVLVQRKTPRGWVTLSQVKVQATGTFSYRFYVTAPGVRVYRAVAPATARRRKGVSPTVRVTGWRWRYVSRMTWFHTGDWNHGPATIAGVSYADAIWADNDFWGDLEVNLDARCTRLRGVAGLTSDSESGSRGTLEIARDGASIYSGTFTMPTTQALDLNITGTLRIAFHMATLTGSTFPDVGIGNARVYCAS